MKAHSSSYLFFTLAIITLCLSLSGCSVNNGKDDDDITGGPDPVNHEPLYFGSPAWHPDGQWIASEHGAVLPDSFIRGGIWLIDAQTGQIQDQPLLDWGSAPSWSPDGTRLVVHHNAHIFTVPVTNLAPPEIDTNNIKQLTTEGRNFYPAWSPDGQWIAYDNTTCGTVGDPLPQDSCGILLRNLQNTSDEELIARGRYPSWSVLSSKIIYTGLESKIYTVETGSGNLLQLTEGETDDLHPQFSPDGSTIVFLSVPELPEPAIPAIWAVESNGTSRRKLSPDWVGGFTWSPDGASIVYIKYNPNEPVEGNGQLWLMDPDGGNLRQLTHFDPDEL